MTPYETLISPQQLNDILLDPRLVVVDCRFQLVDTSAGRAAYLAGHIPGAVYAHLDDDLSGPPATDHGRHPLPTPAALTATFRRLGISDGSQVVAYDDAGGMIASRLWWLLRYMGHRTVAVLDGGWPRWTAEGRPVAAGAVTRPPGDFSGAARADWLVTADEVPGLPLLIDSRGAARFRGDEEPLDPVAGHIPGALNAPHMDNLGDDGLFLPPDALRARFTHLLSDTPPAQATFYCGSGVSACVNLLAMAHAGLGDGRLYAGSWSDWIADPERPVATGA